jgi:hypothetical protein
MGVFASVWGCFFGTIDVIDPSSRKSFWSWAEDCFDEIVSESHISSQSMAEEATPKGTDGIPYKFDCSRSYLHRYIPADGVWVGLNGFQRIILNFYNDIPPLPKARRWHGS